MKQHSSNTETGRKSGGSASFTDTSTPSKAPGQDEDVKEFLGPGPSPAGRADTHSSQQGISNRPASEEHAFPASDQAQDEGVDAPDSVETDSKQMGGPRGGV